MERRQRGAFLLPLARNRVEAPALVRLGQDLADVAEHVTLVQEHVVARSELETEAAHSHLLKNNVIPLRITYMYNRIM